MRSPLQAYLSKQAFQNVATGQANTVASVPAAVHTSAQPQAPRYQWAKTNAPRIAAGAGLVGNAIGAAQSLMNKSKTEEGISYSNPSYVGAGVNAGMGAYNAKQLYDLRGGRLLNAAAPAAAKGAGKGLLGTVGKAAGPVLGGFSALSRITGDKPDYLGAGIDAVGAAAPAVGTALGGPPGAMLGSGVMWGAQGVNAVRDIISNREQTKPVTNPWGVNDTVKNHDVNMQNSFTPGGTLLGANSPTPPTQPTQPAPTSPEGSTQKYAHMNSTELKSFASGFIKAAMQKGVSISDFQHLVKQALSSGGRLTYDDVRALKDEMSDAGMAEHIYADPSGEAMRNYRAKLLAARDSAAGDIPAVSSALSGLGAGAMGASIGGGLGASLGAVGKHSGLLNLPYKYRQYMPTAGALGGAALGGIVAALPAAKSKYDSVKALQKLHDIGNVRDLQQLNATDKALLEQ
jgi:hypothetical protein